MNQATPAPVELPEPACYCRRDEYDERGVLLVARGTSYYTADQLRAYAEAYCRAEGIRADGWRLVPVEPSLGLLVSMAIRSDHGLGVPGYYDQPMFGDGGPGQHRKRLESAVRSMRQLYEEVVGTGFHNAERDASYAAMLAPKPEAAP